MCVLTLAVDVILSRKEEISCALADYQKAFDYVWGVGLLSKLLAKGIDHNTNTYANINSYDSASGESLQGLRQAENLFPFLFSLFINDLVATG